MRQRQNKKQSEDKGAVGSCPMLGSSANLHQHHRGQVAILRLREQLKAPSLHVEDAQGAIPTVGRGRDTL